MRQAHQIAVRPRRIDDDEIERPLHRADGVHELQELRRFIVGDLHAVAKLDAAMHGEFEIEAGAASPSAPVTDVARKTLLAAIEVNGGDALAGLEQCNGNMQGGGGFSRTTLLIAQHKDMRRARLPLTSLHKHVLIPAVIFKSR